MKHDYLKRLRELLDRYNMEEVEKVDILNDYEDMYDSWLGQEYTDEEVERKLGRPRSIIGSLTEGYKRASKPQPKGNKLVALMPFISTVIFFVLGFGFGGWTYSWMAYLLIPVTAIFVNMIKDEHLFTALSPFVATITYFILGFYYNLWHPGWLIFLIIPVLGIFNSRKDMRFKELITALSPFVAIVAFIFLIEQDMWVPGWVVFLIIPAFGMLNDRNKGRMIIGELLLLGGVAAYLYLGYTFEDMWGYAALVFIPLVSYEIMIGNIEIRTDGDVPNSYKIIILITAVAYFVVSFLTKDWAFTWVIIFIIPVFAIIRETGSKEKLIALMPFIATTIFMVLGFYFDLWAWAWLAFLIIPVTAIVKNA